MRDTKQKHLQVVDDIRDGVDALLHGEGEAVVLGADEVGNLARVHQIRRSGEANGEGFDGGEVFDLRRQKQKKITK